jgi:hypothetical protein
MKYWMNDAAFDFLSSHFVSLHVHVHGANRIVANDTKYTITTHNSLLLSEHVFVHAAPRPRGPRHTSFGLNPITYTCQAKDRLMSSQRMTGNKFRLVRFLIVE